MVIQDYWNLYHDKDYLHEHRNQYYSYGVMKGGHYGYKSMWNYAKNNVPKNMRMKFMTWISWSMMSKQDKERLYEIASHWYLGDDKMPHARRPTQIQS